MFVRMLEIEEEDRADFTELQGLVGAILNPQSRGVAMLQSGSSYRGQVEYSRGNRTPGRQAPAPANPVRTPKASEQGKYRNDVSPFRGRFGGAVKNGPGASRRTPEQVNRSPTHRNRAGNSRQKRETFGSRPVEDFRSNRNVTLRAERNFC